MLQKCLPQNVRHILMDLPDSLDETYERILREIGKVNPNQAYRLLQCLTVATRPLRVEELAEVLALDFDRAEGGIPALNEDWRWDDQQQGVLSTCSSLIVVVDYYDDVSEVSRSLGKVRVVQFAHFSVKEFLTSDRLANLKADISRFHIRLEPAHIVMAQACLAILLQSDYGLLSNYAAQHWVDHAQFENVSLRVVDGMRRLFDPAKPYFTAWVKLYNIGEQWWFVDGYQGRSSLHSDSTSASYLCIFYAAMHGFCGLTEHLIAGYPQHINARVGRNHSPLAAALRNRHYQVADLLYRHGAVLHMSHDRGTPLHAASEDGLAHVAQWILEVCGVDTNQQNGYGEAPLHLAAWYGHLEVVRTLLGHSADLNAVDRDNVTPLHKASQSGHFDIVRLLIQTGAEVNARDKFDRTPLHGASDWGKAEIVQLLIQYGADINARDKWEGQTPLHRASDRGRAEVVQVLIQLGADINAQDDSQSTPLHMASTLSSSLSGVATIVRLLIEHGAGVNACDGYRRTPLHWLVNAPDPDTLSLSLLLDNGADMDVEDGGGLTPFQIVSSHTRDSSKIITEKLLQKLSEHRASVVSNK